MKESTRNISEMVIISGSGDPHWSQLVKPTLSWYEARLPAGKRAKREVCNEHSGKLQEQVSWKLRAGVVFVLRSKLTIAGGGGSLFFPVYKIRLFAALLNSY